MKRVWPVLCLVVACSDPPRREPTPAPSAPASADGKTALGEAARSEAPAVKMVDLAPGVQMPETNPDGLPHLTPHEFALLMIDTADLPVDERRKKAFARRKVIMNNPDGPTARALEDLREAAQAGEVDLPPKRGGVVFTLPGYKPTSGPPPAGVRPPAGSDKAGSDKAGSNG